MNRENIKKISLFVVVGLVAIYALKTQIVHQVTISDESNTYYLSTYDSSVEKAIKRAGIILDEADVVMPARDAKIDQNTLVTIDRAKPVTIIEGDRKTHVLTAEKNVGNILSSAGILLDKDDQSYPKRTANIANDRTIEVIHLEVIYETTEEIIPFSTVYKMTESLSPGATNLITEGKDGVISCTFKVVYENGVETSRQLNSETLVVEPEYEIIEEGMDKWLVTSRGMPFRYSEVIVMRATAYDLSYESCGKYPGDKAYGITYSGTKARPGVVAVDPRVVKLGSNVYVESTDRTRDYGFATAEDTGSAIKGNRIDLFIENRSDALKYGVHTVNVYVLDQPVSSEMIVGYSE